MKQQRTTPAGRLGKAQRSLRLEPLEGRLLLHGNGVDPHEPVQTELLQSVRSFLSSVAGGLAGSPSLVESAPDGCGLTAVDQGLMAVDQGPSVADRGWLAGGGQPWSAATGDLELGGITCCCPACLAVADLDAPENATALADAGPAGATVPLSSLPILNSLAGAAVSLYLNFVGRFDAFWGTYTNVTTPAFDQDGDASSFSSALNWTPSRPSGRSWPKTMHPSTSTSPPSLPPRWPTALPFQSPSAATVPGPAGPTAASPTPTALPASCPTSDSSSPPTSATTPRASATPSRTKPAILLDSFIKASTTPAAT